MNFLNIRALLMGAVFLNHFAFAKFDCSIGERRAYYWVLGAVKNSVALNYKKGRLARGQDIARALRRAEFVMREVETIDSLEKALVDFPLDPHSLAQAKRVEDLKGLGFLKIEKAQYRGEDVFIKTVHTNRAADGQILEDGGRGMATRRLKHVLAEIKWAKFAEKMGWGPALKGVYKNDEGRVSLVYQWVDGVPFNRSDDRLPVTLEGREKRAVIQRMGEMQAVFKHFYIVPNDLQFILDKKGQIHLVDTELFFQAKNPYPLSLEEAEGEGLEVFPESQHPQTTLDQYMEVVAQP